MFQSLVTVSPYSLWAICRRKSICSAREFCGMGTVHSFTVKIATNGRNQCFNTNSVRFCISFQFTYYHLCICNPSRGFCRLQWANIILFPENISSSRYHKKKWISHIWKRPSETFVANLQCFADDKKEIKGTLVELLTHSPGSEHFTLNPIGNWLLMTLFEPSILNKLRFWVWFLLLFALFVKMKVRWSSLSSWW